MSVNLGKKWATFTHDRELKLWGKCEPIMSHVREWTEKKITHVHICPALPATVYLKMIDIWLFGGLIVPFIIIGVLVILDYKVIKESNDVIEMQKENDNKWSSKCFIKTMRIMLLVIVAFLVASYWIIGLTHYFT